MGPIFLADLSKRVWREKLQLFTESKATRIHHQLRKKRLSEGLKKSMKKEI